MEHKWSLSSLHHSTFSYFTRCLCATYHIADYIFNFPHSILKQVCTDMNLKKKLLEDLLKKISTHTNYSLYLDFTTVNQITLTVPRSSTHLNNCTVYDEVQNMSHVLLRTLLNPLLMAVISY